MKRGNIIARSLLAGVLIFTIAAFVGLGPAPAKAETIKLTSAAGHPPGFLWVKLLTEFFIPEVNKRLATGGKHKIEWTEAYGGTLVKLGSESAAIKDGIADLGFVSTIFEASKFPLQNVSYMAPFGTDNIDLVTKVTGDLQNSIPAMSDAWSKNNLLYLGGAALDTYHIWSTFPIKTIDDMKGRKISAPGPSANWVKNTGAVAVAGTLSTYYNDIKTGVSDGTLTFITGAWGAKVHEVAPFITKVNFGAMFAGGIAINKARFDKFPPEVQKIFREVGDEYAVRFAKAQAEAAEGLLQRMAAAGAKVSELDPKERLRWAEVLPNVARPWAADLDGKGLQGTVVLKGYMDGLKKAGASLPRDWTK